MSEQVSPGSPIPGSSKMMAAAAIAVDRWRGLNSIQRLRLIWGAFGLSVVVAAILWWASRPDWRVLYTGLAPDDARQMGTLLTAANLTYDVSQDGTTLKVPVEELDKARLSTAGKAGGKTGRIGFELFDKPDWAGSDFDEKVNYQRALEGELEHTIDSLTDVQSSRVHLVLPHDSLFTEAQRDAKASVLLRLKSRRLTDEEAASVKSLVASAVDDLSPDHVVLLDSSGGSLLGDTSGSNAKTVYEQLLSERILQTLEPVVGLGNVRATVNIEYDLSSRDEMDENYDPASVVTLSMQRAEQVAGSQAPAQGVPGTASNAPNQQVPLFPVSKPDAQSSKQESGTYGASKKTKHLVEGPGKVRRLTAAILVNDHVLMSNDKKKGVQHQPWTAEELKELVALAEASVGYEEARGDRVVVQNLRFDVPIEASVGPLHKIIGQSAWLEPFIKDMIFGSIAVAFLLFTVRPAMKIIKFNAAEPRLLSTSKRIDVEQTSRAELEEKTHGTFEQVVDHIQRDPAQSARVLQTWIRAD